MLQSGRVVHSDALSAERIADGAVVDGITSSLDPVSRVSGNPNRLTANIGILRSKGSISLESGLRWNPAQAEDLDCSRSTQQGCVVPLPQRSGSELAGQTALLVAGLSTSMTGPRTRLKTYPECYDQVRSLVKPERDTTTIRSRAEKWWRYLSIAANCRRRSPGLDRVIAITRVSKAVNACYGAERASVDRDDWSSSLSMIRLAWLCCRALRTTGGQ